MNFNFFLNVGNQGRGHGERNGVYVILRAGRSVDRGLLAEGGRDLAAGHQRSRGRA